MKQLKKKHPTWNGSWKLKMKQFYITIYITWNGSSELKIKQFYRKNS